MAAAETSVQQGECLRTLVTAGNAGLPVRGYPAGMLKSYHVQAQQPCSPPLLPIVGILLFGFHPSLSFLQEQIYEQSFAVYPLSLSFSGFPAIAVIACTEMQVIYLLPASFAW